jgi:hypothetical protein
LISLSEHFLYPYQLNQRWSQPSYMELCCQKPDSLAGAPHPRGNTEIMIINNILFIAPSCKSYLGTVY